MQFFKTKKKRWNKICKNKSKQNFVEKKKMLSIIIFYFLFDFFHHMFTLLFYLATLRFKKVTLRYTHLGTFCSVEATKWYKENHVPRTYKKSWEMKCVKIISYVFFQFGFMFILFFKSSFGLNKILFIHHIPVTVHNANTYNW